jgi:cytochrome c-type biogenesis protein
MTMGFAASSLGTLILTNKEVLAQISGVVVIIFGLHFLGVFRIALLDRDVRLDAGDQGGTALGAFVLGLAFAFGWTPCNGPQLGAILSLALQEDSRSKAVLLLGVYSVGLGLPFLLAAVFIDRSMGLMARMKPHMKTIERVMGLLLIGVGLSLVLGTFTDFSWWLVEIYSKLGIPELG